MPSMDVRKFARTALDRLRFQVVSRIELGEMRVSYWRSRAFEAERAQFLLESRLEDPDVVCVRVSENAAVLVRDSFAGVDKFGVTVLDIDKLLVAHARAMKMDIAIASGLDPHGLEWDDDMLGGGQDVRNAAITEDAG